MLRYVYIYTVFIIFILSLYAYTMYICIYIYIQFQTHRPSTKFGTARSVDAPPTTGTGPGAGRRAEDLVGDRDLFGPPEKDGTKHMKTH